MDTWQRSVRFVRFVGYYRRPPAPVPVIDHPSISQSLSSVVSARVKPRLRRCCARAQRAHAKPSATRIARPLTCFAPTISLTRALTLMQTGIDIDTTVGTHSSKQPAVAHLVLGSRSAPHSQTIANLPGWGRARPQSSASSHNHSRAVSTSHTPSPHSAAKWQRLVELDVHACDSAAYLASPAG